MLSGMPSPDDLVEPPGRRHAVAPPSQWPWLPRALDGTLGRHPYCTDCGEVKATGSRRALDMGGLVNRLGRLFRSIRRAGNPVTEAQRRLILQRIQSLGADDAFALTRDHQDQMVAGVVAQFTGLPARIVESYARSC